MEIVGDRRFVEVPGSRTYELPPLLVHSPGRPKRLDRVMNMASDIVESEEMISTTSPATALADEDEIGRRRMDLALNLIDQYYAVARQWEWGCSVLEWIRQCEMSFESWPGLRTLLRNDVWPHAGRSSFVRLLADKSVVVSPGVPLERAVGLALAYRERPSISRFSNQFFFYLHARMAATAYEAWADLNTPPVNSLPPERFSFQIIDMNVQ